MSKKTEGSSNDPAALHPDPHEWIRELKIETTKDVQVPTRLIDQVLGQDAAVAVAKKAAEQKRHLLLIGDPGTGKSMLAKAMTEILPMGRQSDVLTYHNNKNPNNPKIAIVPGGTGRPITKKYEHKAKRWDVFWRVFDGAIITLLLGTAFYAGFFVTGTFTLLLEPNYMIFGILIMVAVLYGYMSAQRKSKSDYMVPKILIEHKAEPERAPYVEGTGSHAGALLGDVRHDPFQSGGLETPPHQRVEVGAIHRAHNGVLFIDEINVLRLESQQALLTAMQDRKYSIVGQSQTSAGAMTRTEPFPCDFILVAAGNLDAVRTPEPGQSTGMHPALRSRIRGYGYEVFVNSSMDDTHDNRMKLVQFVAQEVVRDGKIPHFTPGAVAEIIREAQRRSGRTGKLTLRLRELGGLVRTAGDFAREAGAEIVTLEHVRQAKGSSRSLEQQITDKEIEHVLADNITDIQGSAVGVANGLAIIGTGEVGEPAGLVVPVEAAVVPALSRHGGTIVLGHGIKDSRGSGVENVGAVLKTLKGSAIADHDLHIDANIHHHNASAEGIGLAAAVASISALESIPVKRDVVFAGSIGVNGELRPARATLQRIEAAMRLGFHHAVVPESLRKSLLLDDYIREKIQVHYCRNLSQVLELAIDAPEKTKHSLVQRILGAETGNGNGHAASTTLMTKAVRSRRVAAE